MFRHVLGLHHARLADVEEDARRVPTVGDLDVVEALGSLVDKSLLRMTDGEDGRPRFSMLQTIREYGPTNRLGADPEPAASTPGPRRPLHGAGTRAAPAPHLRGPSGRLGALGAELGNLRAAWDHWVTALTIARLGELLEPLWGYLRGPRRLPGGHRARRRLPARPVAAARHTRARVTTSSPCRPTSPGRTSRSAASRLTPSARSATRSIGSKLSATPPGNASPRCGASLRSS